MSFIFLCYSLKFVLVVPLTGDLNVYTFYLIKFSAFIYNWIFKTYLVVYNITTLTVDFELIVELKFIFIISLYCCIYI